MTETSTDDLEDVKEQYKPDVTTLSGIYRNPMANPLATVAATVILATFAYQGVVVAVEHSLFLGAMVGVITYVAYRIARVGWTYENEFIATALARRDLEDEHTA